MDTAPASVRAMDRGIPWGTRRHGVCPAVAVSSIRPRTTPAVFRLRAGARTRDAVECVPAWQRCPPSAHETSCLYLSASSPANWLLRYVYVKIRTCSSSLTTRTHRGFYKNGGSTSARGSDVLKEEKMTKKASTYLEERSASLRGRNRLIGTDVMCRSCANPVCG